MIINRLVINDIGRFHLGDATRDIQNIFSSHQLFSAVINSVNTLYGAEKAQTVIDDFISDKLSFSSLFMGLKIRHNRTGQEKPLYFFPLPQAPIRKIGQTEQEEDEGIAKRKQRKKLKYVSLAVLEKLLKTWKANPQSSNKAMLFDFDILKDLCFIGSSIGVDRSEVDEYGGDEVLKKLNFMFVDSKPHNRIHRLTGTTSGSGQVFYDDSLVLKKTKLGSWTYSPFMYFFIDGEISKEVRAAIRLMADEGIGGKRSKGMGVFDGVEQEAVPKVVEDMLSEKNGSYFYSLGTLLPQKREVDQLVAYSLKRVDGYIHSGKGCSIRKKAYRMLQEGCISKGRIAGQLAEVHPANFNDHTVYLCGKGIQIGFGDK